jgi:hypothetical protein
MARAEPKTRRRSGGKTGRKKSGQGDCRPESGRRIEKAVSRARKIPAESPKSGSDLGNVRLFLFHEKRHPNIQFPSWSNFHVDRGDGDATRTLQTWKQDVRVVSKKLAGFNCRRRREAPCCHDGLSRRMARDRPASGRGEDGVRESAVRLHRARRELQGLRMGCAGVFVPQRNRTHGIRIDLAADASRDRLENGPNENCAGDADACRPARRGTSIYIVRNRSERQQNFGRELRGFPCIAGDWLVKSNRRSPSASLRAGS